MFMSSFLANQFVKPVLKGEVMSLNKIGLLTLVAEGRFEGSLTDSACSHLILDFIQVANLLRMVFEAGPLRNSYSFYIYIIS